MPAINLNFSFYVDKSALIAAITTADTKKQNDYTPNSWSPFATSLSTAKTVRDNAIAMQSVVDSATTDLKSKTNALVLRADKSQLIALITTANTKKQSDYTAESWAPFASALSAAITVRDNLNATQAQVNAAAKTLSQKMAALTRKTVTQYIDWGSLINDTYVIRKAYFNSGYVGQGADKATGAGTAYRPYVGLDYGGADVPQVQWKTVVTVTFPSNAKKCTIKCLRSSPDYPYPGGSPAAEVGTGPTKVWDDGGNNNFDVTYCTGNKAYWSTDKLGWFNIDYTSQAKALAGMRTNLIFELTDPNGYGGYQLDEIKFEFEVEV